MLKAESSHVVNALSAIITALAVKTNNKAGPVSSLHFSALAVHLDAHVSQRLLYVIAIYCSISLAANYFIKGPLIIYRGNWVGEKVYRVMSFFSLVVTGYELIFVAK